MHQYKIQPDERAFQKWVKQNFLGWQTQLHPGLGSDVGIPDLLLLTPSGYLPVEIKIGMIEDGILWSKEIRPAQIKWHTGVANAGGDSIFLIGVWSGSYWRAFVVSGADCRLWDNPGYKIGIDAIEINPDSLTTGIYDYVYDVLEA